MTHTPGPWSIEGFEVIGKYIAGDGGEVCEFSPECYNPADAALISAAPDLLEACKYWFENGRFLVANTSAQRAAVDMLRDAIAKAEVTK